MKPKRFNIYAGYHEIHVTDRTLRRPYVFQKTFRNIDRAARWIDEQFPGDAVIIDENIMNCAPDPCWANTDYSEDDIRRGLADITLDNLARLEETPVSPADLRDIVNWMHTVRPRLSIRFFRERYRNLTYGQLRGLLDSTLINTDSRWWKTVRKEERK